MIEIIDEKQLESLVPASAGTSLIFDFYADWCGQGLTLVDVICST